MDVTQEGGEGGNGSSGECLDWDDVIPPQPSQPVLDPIARKRKRGRPKGTRNKPLSETGYKAPNTRRSRWKQVIQLLPICFLFVNFVFWILTNTFVLFPCPIPF